MKLRIFTSFFVCLISAIVAVAQTDLPTPTPTRNRIVESVKTTAPAPTPSRVVITNYLPSPTPTPVSTPKPVAAPVQNPIPVDDFDNPNKTAPIQPTFYRSLSFAEIKNKIAEAKRQMAARPISTALTDSFLMTEIVRVAFYDYKTAQIDYLVMTKTAFLAKSGEISLTTSNGKFVIVRNLRANGVNTPLIILDSENKSYLPLLVQYPVERNGEYMETAYYISSHPGIVTPEVVGAGKLYVHNTINLAREHLRQRGIFISPQVTDMAERLAIVEHVDHYRFRNEYHLNIYNDIFALYALNEGQTYRYSVSSAGAGGMVQMIPSTYRMIRSRYYNVDLMPDFVEGMRNHINASQAMLLYMQMTWNDLISSDTIYNAVADGIATPAELMSAGYNSNPARLAGYIKRGGANWRNLIPRETQIYLQINASLDKFVPLAPRAK